MSIVAKIECNKEIMGERKIGEMLSHPTSHRLVAVP
jgi:hypothetical protein